MRRLAVSLTAALAASLLTAAPALADGEPAGGAAVDQVIIATAGATIATAVLLWLLVRHRAGRGGPLARLAALGERFSGLPGWAALPSAIAAVALLTALLGMYWDISLHIDDGRDAGPLANPAHYLILAGLFGIFAAGCIAIALPARGERPGPAAVRIGGEWYAPVGGLLMAAAAAFALTGFPLDDLWHRIFGQDVTLWGPTHLMLIGGAGLTLVGQAVLLAEGMRARPGAGSRSGPVPQFAITWLRRTGVMGGLLIGLATFQGEFDFGVPQFALIFHPILIALGGGVALVAARIWIGRGGALGAAVFFVVVRGGVSLLVGPVLGETTPALALYLVEALCVEAAALAIARERPLALGAVGGLLIGTVGFASEWGWSQLVMRESWTGALLPEALPFAILAGVAGGVLGGLLGAGLRGRLPRPAVARPAFAAGLVAVAALVANGLVTTAPDDVRARVTLTETRGGSEREALATVRFDPPDAAEDATWVSGIAWQDGPLVVDRLERVREGVYRSTEPLPVHGEWKTLLRLHTGRSLLGLPVYLPEDRAIPVERIEAPASFTRSFVDETEILQRELKDDAPAWIWVVASLVVLAVARALIAALAWGVTRVGGAERAAGRPPRERPVPSTSPTPIGA